MESRLVSYWAARIRPRWRRGGAVIVLVGSSIVGCANPSQRSPKVASSAEPIPVERPAPSAPRPGSGEERVLEIGRSTSGRPLALHIFGEASRPTFIFGGIHGSEPTSAFVARELVAYLRDHPVAYAGTSVAVLPAANPDGLKKRTRANANRIDLNRNFPAKNWRPAKRRTQYYGGARPASEAETRAIVRAVDLLKPARIISIHSITGGKRCNNFDGPGRDLARLMTSYNGYPTRATIGYPTPGSFGSWAGVDRQIPTVTLELPRGQSGKISWRENRDALLAAIRQGAVAVGK